MPIGAFVSSKQHMDCFTHSPILGHITTFGGHPVSAAVAHACVSELLKIPKYLEILKQNRFICFAFTATSKGKTNTWQRFVFGCRVRIE